MTQKLFLLKELVRRDFQSRYAGSVLGLLWSFVQPVFLLALFTFVFSTVMRFSPIGARTESFAVFLFCGLLPWTAFQEGVMRSSTAITEHANLVKKLNFPSELLVLSVVCSGLLHQVIATSIFLLVLIGMGELSWSGLPLLAVALPLQVAFTVGLGLTLSALQVFFRDIAQGLGLVFMGWFYLTPIVYSLGQVPEAYRFWLELNPLTALVELYREAFLGQAPVLVPGVGRLLLVATLALGVGFWLFERLKPTFADEI